MYHTIRWTVEKIEQRIKLIEDLVYRWRNDLPPFHIHIVPDSEPDTPLVNSEVDDSTWPIVEPYSYWGSWRL